jgi:hypothetical protein
VAKKIKKFDIVKSIKKRGRVQQLEWEKTNGKLRSKVIDKKKTTKQERNIFKRKLKNISNIDE